MSSSLDAASRRADPTCVGSAAHFAAVCREAGIRCARDAAYEGAVVVCGKPIDGFVVPSDGAWLVNGRFVEPGHEYAQLPLGTRVEYLPPQKGPIGPYTKNMAGFRAPRLDGRYARSGGGLIDCWGRPWQDK